MLSKHYCNAPGDVTRGSGPPMARARRHPNHPRPLQFSVEALQYIRRARAPALPPRQPGGRKRLLDLLLHSVGQLLAGLILQAHKPGREIPPGPCVNTVTER